MPEKIIETDSVAKSNRWIWFASSYFEVPKKEPKFYSYSEEKCAFIVRYRESVQACASQEATYKMQESKKQKFSASWLKSDALCIVVKVSIHSLRILRFSVDAILVVLLCALIFLIGFQIMGRYVFNYSISWSEEAATFVQVWLVMLGAGLAMRNRNHVGIDLFVARVPAFIQQIAKSAAFLLGAWFLLVVITGSMSLIAIGMIVKSAALRLPMAVPYFALPIGMSYFLLEFALATLPEIYRPAKARQPSESD